MARTKQTARIAQPSFERLTQQQQQQQIQEQQQWHTQEQQRIQKQQKQQRQKKQQEEQRRQQQIAKEEARDFVNSILHNEDIGMSRKNSSMARPRKKKSDP